MYIFGELINIENADAILHQAREHLPTYQSFVQRIEYFEIIAGEIKLDESFSGLAQDKLDLSIPVQKIVNRLVLFLDLLDLGDIEAKLEHSLQERWNYIFIKSLT